MWWDWIQAIFLNIFYLTDEFLCLKNLIINPWFQAAIKAKYGLDATAVGDEGGFAPNFQNNKVILFDCDARRSGPTIHFVGMETLV